MDHLLDEILKRLLPLGREIFNSHCVSDCQIKERLLGHYLGIYIDASLTERRQSFLGIIRVQEKLSHCMVYGVSSFILKQCFLLPFGHVISQSVSSLQS